VAPPIERLRAHAQARLPEYMVPSAYVILQQLPLTPNGKLDRSALPVPELAAYASRKYEALAGEVEELLGGIWRTLLKIDRVGRRDNFFELGGHSLMIVQMMEQRRDRSIFRQSHAVGTRPSVVARRDPRFGHPAEPNPGGM
jgi:hypothetical protein